MWYTKDRCCILRVDCSIHPSCSRLLPLQQSSSRCRWRIAHNFHNRIDGGAFCSMSHGNNSNRRCECAHHNCTPYSWEWGLGLPEGKAQQGWRSHLANGSWPAQRTFIRIRSFHWLTTHRCICMVRNNHAVSFFFDNLVGEHPMKKRPLSTQNGSIYEMIYLFICFRLAKQLCTCVYRNTFSERVQQTMHMLSCSWRPVNFCWTPPLCAPLHCNELRLCMNDWLTH